MKKYSVFSLYVVEKYGHKFICENVFDDEYREVLTKTKLVIENNEKVEPLTEWYSILEIALYDKNLNIKRPLMLTKKNILLKYLEINEKTINKRNDPPYRVIPLDKNLTEEQMKGIMISMWSDYVQSKKDEIPNIPIISSKELVKQKGIKD